MSSHQRVNAAHGTQLHGANVTTTEVVQNDVHGVNTVGGVNTAGGYVHNRPNANDVAVTQNAVTGAGTSHVVSHLGGLIRKTEGATTAAHGPITSPTHGVSRGEAVPTNAAHGNEGGAHGILNPGTAVGTTGVATTTTTDHVTYNDPSVITKNGKVIHPASTADHPVTNPMGTTVLPGTTHHGTTTTHHGTTTHHAATGVPVTTTATGVPLTGHGHTTATGVPLTGHGHTTIDPITGKKAVVADPTPGPITTDHHGLHPAPLNHQVATHPDDHKKVEKRDQAIHKAIAADPNETKGERVKAAIKIPADAVKEGVHKIADAVSHNKNP